MNHQTYKVLSSSKVTLTVLVGNANPGETIITPGNIPPGDIKNVAINPDGKDLTNTSIDVVTLVSLLNSDRAVIGYVFDGGVNGKQTLSPINASIPQGSNSVSFEEVFDFVS